MTVKISNRKRQEPTKIIRDIKFIDWRMVQRKRCYLLVDSQDRAYYYLESLYLIESVVDDHLMNGE